MLPKPTTMKLLILTVALTFVAVLLLSFKQLLVKGSKFPLGHVHDSPGLREKGIGCHREMDNGKEHRQQRTNEIEYKP